MPLSAATPLLLALILVAMPWLAARSHRGGRALSLPRPTLYLSNAAVQWLLALLLVLTLWLEGLGAESIGLRTPLAAGSLLTWTAGTIALGVALGFAFAWGRRALGRQETQLIRHLIPRTTSERWLFALVVAPTAGVVEELLFRGFAINRLAPLAGGPWPAAALTVVSFSLGHVYQGPLGMTRASFLGLLLAVPFLLTGSLWPSILAHTALDILGGVVLGHELLDEE